MEERLTSLQKNGVLPKFENTLNVKIPAGHMIVGVRIPNNPDIMSEWSTPISGLVIMKIPDSLTKADVLGK